MGERREQKGRRLLEWIMRHEGEVLTVEAMAAAVDWTPNSASSAAARFVRIYPDNFERTSKGAYRWLGSLDDATPTAQPVKELYLRVVKRHEDGRMLAVDMEHEDDAGALFVVAPLDPFA